MNLTKLFQMQKELDEPYSHVEDRLSKDILWLQTELGELANEWRGFRYRRPESEQQPRTSGDLVGWINQHGERCIDVRNPLLEEYTDCLCIILSIGLQLELPTNHHYYTYDELDEGETLINQFQVCFNDLAGYSMDKDPYYITELIRDFGSLGIMLGFTWEQIESNYIEKSKLNKERNVIV